MSKRCIGYNDITKEYIYYDAERGVINLQKELEKDDETGLTAINDIWWKITKDFRDENDVKDKIISDLEQKLALTEKALELACSRIKSIYCSDYCGRLCDDWAMSEEDIKNECKIYYKCWNKDCILEQAKEIMKSE